MASKLTILKSLVRERKKLIVILKKQLIVQKKLNRLKRLSK